MSAPDPADYGHLPGDGDYLRGIVDRPELAGLPADQRLDHARRKGMHHERTEGRRPLVDLPADDVQLGSRWRHVLTGDQVAEAMQRGMLRHLMAGHDPDAASSTNT